MTQGIGRVSFVMSTSWNLHMPLAKFMAIALSAALAAGLISVATGSSVGAAFFRSIGVLFALQVAYAILLLVRSLRAPEDRDD